MKIYSYLALLYLLATSCNISYKGFDIDRPGPSFAKIHKKDSISYGRYEVSNLDYKRFLRSIRKSNQVLYQECYIDTTKWVHQDFKFVTSEAYARNYFSHVAYDYFPVVNISHKGAVEYCKWLTKELNKKRKYRNTIIRLPSLEEYLRLLNTVNIKYDSDNIEDYQGYHSFHFNLRFEGNFPADGGFYTTSIGNVNTQWGNRKDKYLQNDIDCFHVVGNAAELLDNGQSIGGSWYSFPSEVKIPDNKDVPDPRVGFRVVMVER